MRTYSILRSGKPGEYALFVKDGENVQQIGLKELEACKTFLESAERLAHSAALTFMSERIIDLRGELEVKQETILQIKQKVAALERKAAKPQLTELEMAARPDRPLAEMAWMAGHNELPCCQ